MNMALDALLGGRNADDVTGTIDENLRELETLFPFPEKAIAVCTLRADECAPVFLSLLERTAAGDPLSDADSLLLFRGLYILGGSRDERAFKPLLRFLSRPVDEVEEQLGDGITEGLPKIAAGVFDGDADALFATICDRKKDEFVRNALIGAATTLAWSGRIDRGRMAAFLERFYRERLAANGDHAWYGWLMSIALLGMEDLAPLVRKAWKEDRIPMDMLRQKDFETLLAEALKAPGDIARLEAEELGYVEDTLAELEWTRGFGEPDNDFPFDDSWDRFDGISPDDFQFGDTAYPGTPAINPHRNVGRNDPCPCGSERKYKRCCLGR